MRELGHVVMNGKGIAGSCSGTICAMKSLRLYVLKNRKPVLHHLVWR